MAHAARSYVPHVPSVNDIVFSHDGAKPVGRRLQGGNNFGQPNLTSIVSVLDFGAVGDSKFDNTNAFQSAINSLATTGGIVYVPSGLFAFNGSLNFPKGVSLVGTYQIVPSHNVGQGGDRLGDGSALLPRANRGDANATAFITLTIDCTVRGFTIWYPDNPETVAPAPYPYTIDMIGDNIAVTDVELLNSWNGIRAVGAHRCVSVASVRGAGPSEASEAASYSDREAAPRAQSSAQCNLTAAAAAAAPSPLIFSSSPAGTTLRVSRASLSTSASLWIRRTTLAASRMSTSTHGTGD